MIPGATLAVLLRPSTIASNEPDKQRDITELRSLGVKFVPGDLGADRVTDLSEYFRGSDTVIGCTGFAAGRHVQLKLAHAALGAGVKRYFPWQFGVDYDAIGRGSTAGPVSTSNLPMRGLLRCTRPNGMGDRFDGHVHQLFVRAQNVHSAWLTWRRTRFTRLGSWDTEVTVTTPEDIGVLTAEVVFTEPRIVNRVVYTASDTITYERLADIVESVIGRKLRRVEWRVPMLKDELAADSDNPIKKYRVVFAEGTGVSWEISKTINAQRGIEVMDVEQWALANLK